ncbi:MAG: DUF4402 domain-containing protein [Sphingopyxis sp.]
MGTKTILKSRYKWPASLLTIMTAVIAACCGTSAYAGTTQQGATETVVLRQLSFIRVDDMNFGDLIPGPTAGTVRLLPNGTRTRTGGVTLVGSSHQPARFAGKGSFNQQVLISLSSNTIQLTGPGAPMTVSLFEIGSTPTAILTTTPRRFRITSASGIFAFPVGASLGVGANQAAGVYSGTFSITLNYL